VTEEQWEYIKRIDFIDAEYAEELEREEKTRD